MIWAGTHKSRPIWSWTKINWKRWRVAVGTA